MHFNRECPACKTTFGVDVPDTDGDGFPMSVVVECPKCGQRGRTEGMTPTEVMHAKAQIEKDQQEAQRRSAIEEARETSVKDMASVLTERAAKFRYNLPGSIAEDFARFIIEREEDLAEMYY